MSTRKEVQRDKQLHQLGEDKRLSEKKYRAALAENRRLQDEMDAALAITSVDKSMFRIKSRERKHDSEATAFAVLSDIHVEEEVKPSTVNYKNKYNLDVAKRRVSQFFERVVRLIRKEEQDVVIHDLVLILNGDMTTGRLHEENLENCLLRPIDAMLYAQDLLIAGLTFLQDNLKQNVSVVCKVGNHGRLTRKVHNSTERGNSLEWMLYHNLAAQFPDMDFRIEDSYHTYLDVYNKTIRVHHGHAVRFHGGVGGLTIPLNKAIHQWNLTKWADLDVVSHFHQHMNMPRFIVNGSVIGFNAFAVSIKAEFDRPQQAFFLVDKKRFRTITAPIFFDT